MKSTWIIFILQTIWIIPSNTTPIQNVYYQLLSGEEFISVPTICDDKKIIQWSSDFHDCFIKRKYEDGGRDLNTIIDRIMEHAEACVETSRKSCRPTYKGFTTILGKVLEQMKDYSDMYLQEIYSGREKIKDLKCVEETLTLGGYETCFNSTSNALDKSDSELQKAVKNGIACTNAENIECSKEARTSVNRMVRTIFSIEQPPEEDEMKEKEEPPPPKRWYNYITDPIVYAWNAIKNWFSGIFG